MPPNTSTVQRKLIFPLALAKKFKSLAGSIPDDHLAEDERETNPHITVKYGLLTEDPEAVSVLLAKESAFSVTFGKTSIFPATETHDYDVLKVDIESPELTALNKKLSDGLDHKDTHVGYKPHATIAYLKTGKGKLYTGSDVFEGETATFDRIIFSSSDGTKTSITLKKNLSPESLVASSSMATEEPPKLISRNFLTKFYDKLKELVGDKLSAEDFNAAVKHARSHAGGVAKAEKSKTASESLSAYIEQVQSALCEWFRDKWGGVSVFSWAREVFTDYVIACSNVDGKFYKIPYTTENDEIQFGEPIEVTTAYVPVGTTEIADLCADGHGARLFMEYNFATPPEWIPYLPKPGKYNSPRYGEIVITEDRNKNFVDNFGNAVYQEKIPIDAEHETALSGACGWITLMRVNDDGSVDAKVDWTDRGTKMIEEDRFKYFSPSWFEKWTDPATEETHSDVAIGGALTTRPFFKEKALRPLVANERGISVFDDDLKNLNSEGSVILNFTALTPATDEQPKGANDMTTGAAPTVQQFTELTTRVEAAEAKATEMAIKAEEQRVAAETATNALKTANETITQLSTSVGELQKDKRLSRFAETAKDWIGDKSKHIEMLEFIATKDEKGEESDQFKAYVEQQNAAAEQIRNSDLFREHGASGQASAAGSAVEKAETKARALMEKDTTLKFNEALQKALSEDSALYEAYRKESAVRV